MRKCVEGLFIGTTLAALLVVSGIGYVKSGIQKEEQKINEMAAVYETQSEIEEQGAYEAVALQLIEDTSKPVTDAVTALTTGLFTQVSGDVLLEARIQDNAEAYVATWEQIEALALTVAQNNEETPMTGTAVTNGVPQEQNHTPEPVPATPVMTVADLLQGINEERSSAGLPAFVWNDSLAAAASVRSVEIVSCFAHSRPDGTEFYTVSELAMAENLARGYFYTTANEVVEKWMESDTGHKQNILDGGLTTIGIHIYEYEDRIAICVLFG